MILHSKFKYICLVPLLITVLLSAASCFSRVASTATIYSPNGWTRTPQFTTTPVFTATYTPIPTLTYGPTLAYISTHYAPRIEDNFLTPPPTLANNQVKSLSELLQSSECRAPCYLSITPGKTTWVEAVSIMESLGAGFYMEKPGGQLRTHQFSFYVTDGKVIPTATNHTVLGDREIHHTIALTIEDGLVQIIRVEIQTIKYTAEFMNYWRHYSVKEILAQNGVPDKVEFTKSRYGGEVPYTGSYDIEIFYKEKGIILTGDVTNSKSLICPDFKDNFVHFEYVFGTNSTDVPPSETSATDWKSVDEVLGITKEVFYNQMISSSRPECFTVVNNN